MKAIFNYLDNLLAKPEGWELERAVHEHALTGLIDQYADSKPRTLEQIITELYTEYPFLRDNVEVIRIGELLYTEIIESMQAVDKADPNGEAEVPPFTAERGKMLEGKISLFNKLVEMRRSMQEIGGRITGGDKTIATTDFKPESLSDRPGTAQSYLKQQR